MRLGRSAFPIHLSIAGFTATPVFADIAFDNITGKAPFAGAVSSDDEFADDTTLSPTAGLTIAAVRARLFNITGTAYTGQLRIWIYADAGGTPGALLGSAQAPINLAPNTDGVFEVPFPSLTVSTRALWTGYKVPLVGPQAQVGIYFSGAPTVGSSTDRNGRHYPDTSWGITQVPNSNYQLQIISVPAPGAVGMLASTPILLLRRRRARQ